MKRRYTVLALPVLIGGAVVAGSDQASARPFDPDALHHRPVAAQPLPAEQVRVEVKVDDSVTEVVQTGAGVLGGAALAMTGLWLYRRRHPLAIH